MAFHKPFATYTLRMHSVYHNYNYVLCKVWIEQIHDLPGQSMSCLRKAWIPITQNVDE